MADEEGYKVQLEGPGLKIDREISKALADQIVLVMVTGQAPAAARGTAQHHIPTHHGELSIREFLDECAAVRGPDKITAIGIYLADHESKADIKRDDLVRQFENASEPVPKNLSRDINWTVKAGWIAPRSGANDTYYVTKTGRDAVAAKFSKDVVQKTKGMTTYVPKKKKGSAAK
ncbi:MAG: hypothetical protein IIA05_08315 [Proteobacteria bacterium]|nr:hypothetical protein [Pseudomonadota bacterium]